MGDGVTAVGVHGDALSVAHKHSHHSTGIQFAHHVVIELCRVRSADDVYIRPLPTTCGVRSPLLRWPCHQSHTLDRYAGSPKQVSREGYVLRCVLGSWFHEDRLSWNAQLSSEHTEAYGLTVWERGFRRRRVCTCEDDQWKRALSIQPRTEGCDVSVAASEYDAYRGGLQGVIELVIVPQGARVQVGLLGQEGCHSAGYLVS